MKVDSSLSGQNVKQSFFFFRCFWAICSLRVRMVRETAATSSWKCARKQQKESAAKPNITENRFEITRGNSVHLSNLQAPERESTGRVIRCRCADFHHRALQPYGSRDRWACDACAYYNTHTQQQHSLHIEYDYPYVIAATINGNLFLQKILSQFTFSDVSR